MGEMSLEKLVEKVNSYNSDETEKVIKAYKLAESLHKGQKRQSGEPYIIHPLHVAYILAELRADGATLCAALLHDTLEDTEITKEEIANLFNPTVALLVDGVTKINKLNFSSSKQDLLYANTRKLIMGIKEDVRIIMIKLADRLHNMRTLQYKSILKQQENAQETLDIFVPLANYLGEYRIKEELEDLSLKYLAPDKYKYYENMRLGLEEESKEVLRDMLYKINNTLNNNNIPNEIKIRIKNIYGIYKKISNGAKIKDIHDLLMLKIIVDKVDECYLGLRYVHKAYHPTNRIKDYICNPKINMYQSLHTTLIAPDGRLVQAQIRTKEMDEIASLGMATYWHINKGKAKDVMHEDLKNNYQFFSSLLEIDSLTGDDKSFVDEVKNELFVDQVHVFTNNGVVISFPKGATAIDFAYKIHSEIGNYMSGAVVNDERVPIDYILQNDDCVKIITDEKSAGPNIGWLEIAQTAKARRKIREFIKKGVKTEI